MKVEKIDILGFRGFRRETFTLNKLTVFQGEMGVGKTSRLLSILFGLTGASPRGLNLDDLINADSEFMSVKAFFSLDGKICSLERKKRRRATTSFSIKPDGIQLPELDTDIFIDGRQISGLFTGGPAERALKLDALLGISEYDQRVSQLTSAPADKRLSEIETLRQQASNTKQSTGRLKEVDDRLRILQKRRSEVELSLSSMETDHLRAKNLLAEAKDSERRDSLLASKKQLLLDLLKKLDDVPESPSTLTQEWEEHEAKWNALQKRKTFIEAAMETLNIEGKRLSHIKLCPLCGALVTDNALAKFEHYDRDYKDIAREIMEFKEALDIKKRQVAKAKIAKERNDLISSQVETLRREIKSLEGEIKTIGSHDEARKTTERYKGMLKQKEEMESTSTSLEDQKRTLESILADMMNSGFRDLEGKIFRLNKLSSDIRAVKLAMNSAVVSLRNERIDELRDSFKETFKKIYPYERFTDVDFETSFTRGKESFSVRGKLGENWLMASQMSTGENVALSFALLFAINRIERAPIILLDEPEEGLDENGVQGLADTLKVMAGVTQVIVATRSDLLANALRDTKS